MMSLSPIRSARAKPIAQSRGYQLVETYVEPGASATNDRRPEFQRMIEAGTSKPAAFDVVIVHSFSRFFRDHFELEFYVRRLAKNGVKLVSITQEMGDDPMHVMMRQIMALFDEYQSKENAKHVLRALKENARQGFWNGSLPPIGYRIVAAEQRGAKVKKKLEIDPLHADTIRLIYRLALEGDGTSGPMGVKNITAYLNRHRLFTRDGGRWGIGQVHRILTRRTYIGEHEFNKRSKAKALKPVSEIVTVAVPPIIDQATFDAVQAHLRSRNPKVTPARVVSGPTLLTGICFCADCGGAMTLRTGKGGRYRYYTCSIKARQGETGCKGRSIPMEKLDNLVAGHIEDRLLQPERLEEVLAAVLDRRQERSERRREHIAELNKRAAETELRLKRLYDAIESGVADLGDPALKDRIAGLKATRDQAQADAERAQAMLGKLRPAGDHAADGAQVRPDGAGAYADRGRRLPSRPSPRARPARRGRGQGSPHHGIEGRFAQNPCRWCGRKAGYARRSQFCSEVADREGFEPSKRLITVYTLSRRAPSTARPPVREARGIHRPGVLRQAWAEAANELNVSVHSTKCDPPMAGRPATGRPSSATHVRANWGALHDRSSSAFVVRYGCVGSRPRTERFCRGNRVAFLRLSRQIVRLLHGGEPRPVADPGDAARPR